jgi:hypothetical protein
MMHFFLALTATLLACPIQAFVITNTTPNRRSSVIVAAAEEPGSAEDLFASEGWQPIKEDLNQLPVFTVATKEGNPLAYEIETKGKTFSVPCFFCDIEEARKELEDTKQKSGSMERIDLVPFPLGQAFELWAKDEAVIVPSKHAILQAGAPPGTNPIGQQVPLFACMDIMEEGENGKGVLPLFMVLEEANAALVDAVEADGGSVDDFEVVSLSLNRAVDLLATVPETPAFHFIPPAASMKYIQEYLS